MSNILQGVDIGKDEVTAIRIPKTKGLDAITVFLQDFGPGQGRITINCYSSVWTYYWGGMGDKDIARFFCSCDNHYIAKNLLQGKTTEVDMDEVERRVKERLGDEYDSYEWDFENAYTCRDKLLDEFGMDWCMDLPTRPTSDFEYLFKIIDVVREALCQVYEIELRSA